MRPDRNTYQELARVARQHYGEKGFCSVLSLAAVTGCAFGRALHAMRRAGRQTRQGAFTFQSIEALKEFKLKAERVYTLRSTTIAALEKELAGTTGRYLVTVKAHILAVVDGQVIDWTAKTESGKASRRRIIEVYRITQE